jgi:hypothetical protein
MGLTLLSAWITRLTGLPSGLAVVIVALVTIGLLAWIAPRVGQRMPDDDPRL